VTVDLTISRLGSDGLGLADHDERILAFPYTLPGERIRIEPPRGKQPAKLVQRLSDAPDRAPPPCRHFGRCGGCLLQHLSAEAYGDFKRRLVLDALQRHGVAAGYLAPTACSPPGTRRRATLHLCRAGKEVRAGFNDFHGQQVVDLAECPVMLPALVALIAPLRRVMAVILKPGAAADAVLNGTATGIDLGLILPEDPDLRALEILAEFAQVQDLARLWWRRGGGPILPIAERRKPQVRLGDIAVDFPAGGFQQATDAGETALVAAVGDAVTGATRLADLFAGIGTFTLSLSRGRTVHAVEGDQAALAALDRAGRREALTGLTSSRRDLEARPLGVAELVAYDAVIFDPPRAGARAQAGELARSSVPVVVAVSCNPASFARDATILIAGGYRLESITPIDQFLWSPHLELVAVFRR
jgi:23S rRNA (uracil1939-C5)-methyltransferase